MKAQPLIKTDVDDLYRDLDSKALINTNVEEYALYKSRRRREKRIESLIDDVETLKSDLSDIKMLLGKIIESRN